MGAVVVVYKATCVSAEVHERSIGGVMSRVKRHTCTVGGYEYGVGGIVQSVCQACGLEQLQQGGLVEPVGGGGEWETVKEGFACGCFSCVHLLLLLCIILLGCNVTNGVLITVGATHCMWAIKMVCDEGSSTFCKL